MKTGTLINERYEILGELGRGGMGIVYRARHLALGREVAIKVFSESVSKESKLRAQREAQALANIKHPNLVSVFAFETDESGHPFLVFDYVDGEPLSKALSEHHKYKPEQAGELFRQLCAGLQALHEHGFIHRDIKPSNLMLTRTADGAEVNLVIIDFGLAKSLDKSQKLTSTGALLGTPLYMSPEQFNASELTPQSDNYSAACVLYEMLTGSPPFADESVYMIANAHMVEPPPTVPEYQQLDAFFARALAKLPAERYKTASEMHLAFEEAARQKPQQRSKGEPTRKRAPADKRKFALITAALLLSAVVAFMVSSSRQNDDADVIAVHTVNEFKYRWGLTPRDYKVIPYLETQIARVERLHPEESMDIKKMYEMYAVAVACPDGDAPSCNYDLAAVYLDKCLEISKHKGTKQDQCNMLYGLAKTYDYAGRWKDAYKAIQTCAQVKGQPILQHFRGMDEACVSHTLLRGNKVNELFDLFGGKIDSRAEQQSVGLASVRRDLATAYILRGNPDRAIKLLAQSEYLPGDAEGYHMRARDLPLIVVAYALAKRHSGYLLAVNETTHFTRPPYLHFMYEVLLPASQAVDDANAGKGAEAKKIIDKLLATKAAGPAYGEVVHSPDQNKWEQMQQMMLAMYLCQEASNRLGDSEREAQCANRIKQIKYELVQDNRIFPDSKS